LKKIYCNQKKTKTIALIIGESTGLDCLKQLVNKKNITISYVICVDKKYKQLVKSICKKNNIFFYSKKFTTNNLIKLKKLSQKSDLLISIYSNIILNKKYLKFFKFKCFNIHPGILPYYPGKNCVSGSIFNKERSIGSSIHLMTTKIDGGDIILIKKTNLSSKDSLFAAMNKLRYTTKIVLKKFIKLQLDGKNHSYLISTFVRSKNKFCVKYIKNKKIFGNFFKIKRPNFFLNLFFNYNVVSYEDYNHLDNKKFHYLNLYLKLLEKINIKIFSKNHNLPFKNPSNITKFNKNYILLHLDTRWNEFPNEVISSLIKKINYISRDNNLVISSNVGSNDIFENIKHEFSNYDNIEMIEGPNLNNTLNLIYFSSTCISSHSGLIVHSAAAFNKKIIDIVSPKIFNELDRWIPFNINYKRFDINNFINFDFDLKS